MKHDRAAFNRETEDIREDMERRKLNEPPRDYIERRLEPMQYRITEQTEQTEPQFFNDDQEDVLGRMFAMCRTETRDLIDDKVTPLRERIAHLEEKEEQHLVPLRQAIAKLEGQVETLMTLLQKPKLWTP